MAAGPSKGDRAHLTARETKAQRRQVTRRPCSGGQDRGPQGAGHPWSGAAHPPHGLVLEAEAGAGAVDVLAGAAVVQQAGGRGGRRGTHVGDGAWAPPPLPMGLGAPGPSWPPELLGGGSSLTLGLTSSSSPGRAPNQEEQ